MKNILTREQLNEKTNFTEDDYKSFCKLVNNQHFDEAFDYAQENGIFGGNFSEWLEARKKQNSTNSKIYKTISTYQNICKELAQVIVHDLQADNDYFSEQIKYDESLLESSIKLKLNTLIPKLVNIFSNWFDGNNIEKLEKELIQLEKEAKTLVDNVKSNASLWWKYSKDDDLANTPSTLINTLNCNPSGSNHRFELERMKHAMNNLDGISIYYS